MVHRLWRRVWSRWMLGRTRAAIAMTSADRHRLFGPAGFVMTAPALAAVLERACAVLPAGPVKVGVEAAGYYHRPLLGSGVWPRGWDVLELSPARVSEQRRVQGRRRVKTDAIDLEAITELVLAGHGVPVTPRAAAVTELRGWAMQRGRWVLTRTATKNQLLAQLDRCFPGLTVVLPDVLGTKVGRLVAAEFVDPHRLAALGSPGLSGSPRTVGCGFGGRPRTGWWRQPAPPCRPRRLWWPARCWPMI
jgi:transposase